MKSSTIVIVLIVILIACICCLVAACGLGTLFYFTGSQSGEMNFGTSTEVGQPAPNFQLGSIDGKEISLEDFRGKPVMLNFWAVWCSPCIEEMPLIQARYQQHHPDLIVLGIEEVGNFSELQNFAAEAGLSFTILAGDEAVARQYNVHAYPTSFFIDADGVIQSIVVGSLSETMLDSALAKIGVGE